MRLVLVSSGGAVEAVTSAFSTVTGLIGGGAFGAETTGGGFSTGCQQDNKAQYQFGQHYGLTRN